MYLRHTLNFGTLRPSYLFLILLSCVASHKCLYNVYAVARLHPKYLPIHHYNPRQPTLMAVYSRKSYKSPGWQKFPTWRCLMMMRIIEQSIVNRRISRVLSWLVHILPPPLLIGPHPAPHPHLIGRLPDLDVQMAKRTRWMLVLERPQIFSTWVRV